MDTSLKQVLIDELEITRQAIEQRRNQIKIKYGPMSDDEAYGVIGHLEGIDVSKLLNSDTLSRVRDICFKIQSNERETPHNKAKNNNNITSKNSSRLIRIGNNSSFEDPLLPQRVLEDAKKMTEVYAKLYVFENSVREVINRVMANKFNTKDWWNQLNGVKAKSIRHNVNIKMGQEEKNLWHGRRGNHQIHYTDITDLINIFGEYWSYFSDFFPSQAWVENRIREISMSRNIIDHHNPLNNNDQKRLDVYFTDWVNQIKSIKDKLAVKEDKP